MKPEAQQIAILQACGWTPKAEGFQDKNGNWLLARSPNDNWMFPPDYLNDLNAMRCAVERLRENQFWYATYFSNLFKVVTGLEWHGDIGYFGFTLVQATAVQCAEAFLRTIGKWVDE